MKHEVRIVESYRDYSPPMGVSRAVARMIHSVPPKYLSGLGSVVLTNSSALPSQRKRGKVRSRGRKVALRDCLGLYTKPHRGGPPWIEVFVDRVFDGVPRAITWVPLLRDIVLSDTIFHEVGHHIHATHVRSFQEKESVAEAWTKWLRGRYLRRHHWYVVPLAVALKGPAWVWRRLSQVLRGRQN